MMERKVSFRAMEVVDLLDLLEILLVEAEVEDGHGHAGHERE